jgi:hypothetical protein
MLAVTLLLVAGAGNAQAAQLGYNLQVTTAYGFSNPFPNEIGFGFSPSPDTSFFQVKNIGSTTFTGTISDVAVSQFAGDFSGSVGGLTLAPGQIVSFSTSPESSNVGGFNGPFNNGTPQPGIEIHLMGFINGTEAVNLSVNDSAIHSGVPRTNPFGVTLDNYVLQGGDPFGRDAGDSFEVTQANGVFTFFEPAGGVVPEPSSWLLLTLGVPALWAARRLRKKA